MKRQGRRVAMTCLLVILSLWSGVAQAAALVWQTSRQAAVDLALAQQRKILLVAGRDT